MISSCIGHTPSKFISTVRGFIFDYYNECVIKVSNLIKAAKQKGQKFAVTLDEWNSICNKKFLNVSVFTSHKRYNLGLHKIERSACSTNIKQLTI